MKVGKIEIIKKSIIELETDAIVNAANEALQEGAGVCGVIFKAAGSKYLQAACDAIGGCKTGSAVVTPGFGLKNKYIIHAVGPRWIDGKHNEAKLLSGAYKQALSLAVKNGCKSIGFPLISAGIFGYPVDQAWQKALQVCLDFQKANPNSDLDIQFAVIDGKVLEIGQKILLELKKEKTTEYLTKLDEAAFMRIRDRIGKESDKLIDKKAHPMAGGLMEVICESRILEGLSMNQLLKVVESIFPGWLMEESWLAKYGDFMTRIIDVAKKKKACDRAAKYENYLRTVLVQTLKMGSRSGNIWDDLDTLVDIYKTTVCLFKYYTDPAAEFVFQADWKDMEKLNQSIQNVTGTGAQVLGVVFVPVKPEERQYAIFLSWILEEMLAEQECVEKEG